MSGVERMRGRSATAFVKMNAQMLTLVFLEALLVALATGASIGGSVSLNESSLSTETEIVFPKIPGINKPLLPDLGDIIKHLIGSKSDNVSDKSSNDRNIADNSSTNDSTDSTNIDNQTEENFISTNMPNDNSQTNDSLSIEEVSHSSEPSAANELTENSQSTDGQTNSGFKPVLPKIPKLSDLIPKIPAIPNPSNVSLPQLPHLPSLSDLAHSPELAAALEKARNMTAAAIGHGSDLISGIHKAMEQAIRSINPTQAFRDLVGTILKTYLAVAKTNPKIALAIKVANEGVRLAFEVAKSVKNIISA